MVGTRDTTPNSLTEGNPDLNLAKPETNRLHRDIGRFIKCFVNLVRSRQTSEELALMNDNERFEYREYFESLLGNAPDGIVCISDEGETVMINESFANIHGYTLGEMCGINLQDLKKVDLNRVTSGEDLGLYDNVRPGEVSHRHKDGHIVHLEESWWNAEIGGHNFNIHLYRDITKHMNEIEQLRIMGYVDSLTGLFNKRYFVEKSKQLGATKRDEFPVSIIYIDLDKFKSVNDTYGHKIGDDFLVRMGEVLRQTFRPDDCLARLGGDEFAVLLTKLEEPTIDNLVGRLKGNLANNNRQYPAYPPISISIAYSSASNVESLAGLVEEADLKMYEVKKQKRLT